MNKCTNEAHRSLYTSPKIQRTNIKISVSTIVRTNEYKNCVAESVEANLTGGDGVERTYESIAVC